MDRETIKWVLEILRDCDFDTAMEVITNLDVNYIVSEMVKEQKE